MTPSADDGVLIAAAQSGDTAASDAPCTRHYDHPRHCRRLAGNAADADGATQEAVLSAIVRGLPASTATAAFSTWSYCA